MDADTLERLIERRDETVRDLGRFMPETLQSLLDGHVINIFDGIVVRKVVDEYVKEIQSSRYDAWGSYGYDDVSKRLLILSVTEGDTEQFFKIEMYYDSWDNGEVNEWKITNTQEVQRVPIEKYEWKEVW